MLLGKTFEVFVQAKPRSASCCEELSNAFSDAGSVDRQLFLDDDGRSPVHPQTGILSVRADHERCRLPDGPLDQRLVARSRRPWNAVPTSGLSKKSAALNRRCRRGLRSIDRRQGNQEHDRHVEKIAQGDAAQGDFAGLPGSDSGRQSSAGHGASPRGAAGSSSGRVARPGAWCFTIRKTIWYHRRDPLRRRLRSRTIAVAAGARVVRSRRIACWPIAISARRNSWPRSTASKRSS